MAIDDLNLEFEDESEKEKSDALEVDVDLSFSASGESGGTPAREPVQSNVNPNAQVHIDKQEVSSSKKSAKVASNDDVTDPNIRSPKKKSHPTPKATSSDKGLSLKDRMRQKLAGKSEAPKEQKQAQSNVSSIQQAAVKREQQTQQTQSTAVAMKQTSQLAQPAYNVNEEVQDDIHDLRVQIQQLREELSQVKYQADLQVEVAQAKTEFMVEILSNAKLLDHQVNQLLQRIHAKVPGLKNEVLMIKKVMKEFEIKNSQAVKKKEGS